MKSSKKIKVVIDTNILISFFCFPGGIIKELVKKALISDYEIIISDEIPLEFERVIKKKFPQLIDDLWQFTGFIKNNFIIKNPVKRINAVKNDPTDNKIIECAVEANADYIISGDRHLLNMKKFRGIKILTPAEFFKREM